MKSATAPFFSNDFHQFGRSQRASAREAGFFAAFLCGLLSVAVCPAASAQAGEWTWVGGNSTFGSDYTPDGSNFNVYARPGVYGSQGQFASGNLPGGRFDSIYWTDKSGNEWVFSGFGDDADGNQGFPNDLWEYSASKGQWAWMGGSTTIQGTDYGHNGVCPSTAGAFNSTSMPGSRYSGVSWTDASGNLWLFGGFGYDAGSSYGYLNDMWEFDPTLGTYGEWTWLGGSCTVPSANGGTAGDYPAQPGATGTKYIPGSRINAVSWIDKSGNLWLFGGLGFDSSGTMGWLNDLWKFDPSTKEWTWMGGGSTIGSSCSPLHTTYPTQVFCGEPGSYGTRGEFAEANFPGARANAVGLTDSHGNFWLFGGNGYFADNEQTFLNDLWEFNPDTNEWAWISGNSKVSADGAPNPGVYGTEGAPAVGNYPGGRIDAYGWTDAYGNIWIFGGQGDVTATSDGFPNDLWVYHPPTGEWTWMNGLDTLANGDCTSGVGACGVPGVYPASTGDTAQTNEPGGRHASVNWTDADGNLWLLEGAGFDSSTTNYGLLNDLWEYHTPTPAATPVFKVSGGSYTSKASVTLSDSTKGAAIYYTIDGTTPTTASSVYKSAITPAKAETIKALAVSAGYLESAISSAAVVPPQAAPPTFHPEEGPPYIAPLSVKLRDETPGAVIYYALHGEEPSINTTKYTRPILIDSTTTVKAIAVAPGFLDSSVAPSKFSIVKAQTIYFPKIKGTYDAGSKLRLHATASSELPVSFASETPKVCSVSGAMASLLAAGKCTILATQDGNAYYAPAPPVPQSFQVVKSQ